MTDSENPYESPSLEASAAAQRPTPESASEDELIRRRHLSVETSIAALGGLFFIIGAVVLFFMIPNVWNRYTMTEAIYVVLWSVLAAVLMVLGVQFAAGGYVLYLLLGARGRFVFSADYAAIRSRTPHIKYQPGNGILVVLLMIIVAIFLGLLLPAIR
ncbi:MAG: hypothetical protein K8T91_07125 [Planctomycetes bacterium]|nr:hypothetical protein [Planctomycetota bacterium]